ncbi:hypothetical protein ACGF4C_15040 [Streptomyces sp. NPDC048197]|uniref:hypothetical protein n=1 Tax=Streptomyces sp. NPDC048197 TaxID=3365511 RepID=UPI00371CA58A
MRPKTSSGSGSRGKSESRSGRRSTGIALSAAVLPFLALAVLLGRTDTGSASGVRNEGPAYPGPHPTMIGYLHEEEGKDDWMVLVPAPDKR